MATVKNLFSEMTKTLPPERLINYEDLSPFDKSLAQKFQAAKQSKDPVLIRKAINDFLVVNGNEVYPNIFIGSKKTIQSEDWLKKNKITQIINVGHGSSSDQYCPNEEPLKEMGITYHGFSLSDYIDGNFDHNHANAIKTINDLMESITAQPHRLLVTCFAGISRSATVVLCYLISKKQTSAFEALKMLRQARDVFPSKQQLIYVARLHNDTFGHEAIDVIDDDLAIDGMRAILKNFDAPTEESP